MADRPFARTIQNAFEPIVPDGHDAGVVDDGHALIEKLADFYSSAFFIGPQAEAALSGLSSTVADEVEIYRCPTAARGAFTPFDVVAYADRKPPTLSGSRSF